MSAIWQRPQVRFWVAVLALLVLSMGLALALVVSYWATAALLSVLLVLAVVGLLNSYQRQRVQLLKFIEQFDESANDRPSQRYLQSLFPELLAVMRQQQQQLLGALGKRITSFDIEHTSGQHVVGIVCGRR